MEEVRKAKIAEVFLDQVFYIFELRDMFDRVFSDENQRILEKVATNYFGKMHYLIKLGFFLEIAKVTDPKRQAGRENLSIRFVNDELLDGRDTDASRLVEEMLKFRGRIENARNRVLGHNDLETYEKNIAHGIFQEAELDSFMANLHEFANLVSFKFLGGIVGDIATAEKGDDIDLLMWLRRGLAFQQIFEAETDLVKKSGLSGVLRTIDRSAF